MAQVPSMRASTNAERLMDTIRMLAAGRPQDVPAQPTEPALSAETLWDRIKAQAATLAEQPAARVAQWIGELTDEGMRGNTRNEEGWAVGGVPFGPNQRVFHGTYGPQYGRINPAHHDSYDLLGKMSHWAEDPRYAGDVYAGMSKNPITTVLKLEEPVNEVSLWDLAKTHPDPDVGSHAVNLGLKLNMYKDDPLNFLSLWGKDSATDLYNEINSLMEKYAGISPYMTPKFEDIRVLNESGGRVIPARLRVKNAIDVASWPPTAEQADDLLKIGAKGPRQHRRMLDQLNQMADEHYTALEQLGEDYQRYFRPGLKAKALMRRPLEFKLEKDPMALSREGFDGVIYGDNHAASRMYDPRVWAVENPAQIESAITGEILGRNIKPSHLHEMFRGSGLFPVRGEVPVRTNPKSWHGRNGVPLKTVAFGFDSPVGTKVYARNARPYRNLDGYGSGDDGLMEFEPIGIAPKGLPWEDAPELLDDSQWLKNLADDDPNAKPVTSGPAGSSLLQSILQKFNKAKIGSVK